MPPRLPFNFRTPASWKGIFPRLRRLVSRNGSLPDARLNRALCLGVIDLIEVALYNWYTMRRGNALVNEQYREHYQELQRYVSVLQRVAYSDLGPSSRRGQLRSALGNAELQEMLDELLVWRIDVIVCNTQFPLCTL